MRRVLSSQFPVLSNVLRRDWLVRAESAMRMAARAVQLTTENWQLRTIVLAIVLAGLAVPSVVRAQQIDFAAGGSTLWSPKPLTASQAFLPPALKGGTYAQASLQYLTERRLGLNFEGAFRPKEGLYNGYQHYRPIFYDVNAVYAHRLAPKARGDFMAGVGGETLLFYGVTNCNYSGGCRTNVNSNHFLIHGGVGVRYYFWNKFFVRPEFHYYYVHDNFEFHSDHVLRIGASIGHTFGGQ